jgi:hypothetical protein
MGSTDWMTVNDELEWMRRGVVVAYLIKEYSSIDIKENHAICRLEYPRNDLPNTKQEISLPLAI